MLPRTRTRAFSLTELLVVIALLLVLAVIAIPASRQATLISRRSRCAGNLREIGALMFLYLNDHQGVFPPGATAKYKPDGERSGTDYWTTYLIRNAALKDLRCFICPSVDKTKVQPDLLKNRGGHGYTSYAYNRYGVGNGVSDKHRPARLSKIDEPGKLLMLFDYETPTQPYVGWYLAARSQAQEDWDFYADRHGGRVNVLFCDGHVESLNREQMLGPGTNDFPWATYKYTER
ncbi:MAG TPA: H-X9-DG-CTERM domain-containing protein [Chthoniobacteraceae bacterium]|nr:H-X9-DG-CTERM domain-containing protein [Chthoniobacteraceae bacterium]